MRCMRFPVRFCLVLLTVLILAGTGATQTFSILRFEVDGRAHGVFECDQLEFSSTADPTNLCYSRQGEHCSDWSTGVLMPRSNAYHNYTHGRIGSTASAVAESGYVEYDNIPGYGRVYYRIRYSRYNSGTDDVRIFLNDVQVGVFNPQNTGNWNSFRWSDSDSGWFQLDLPPRPEYEIVASVTEGGEITPSDTQFVPEGENLCFNINADDCYHLAYLYTDGVSITPLTSYYCFNSVIADHTIHAEFSRDQYEITSTLSAGGSLQPACPFLASCDTTVTFLILPESGMQVDEVRVDGELQEPTPDSITLSGIRTGHNLAISFSAMTYTVDISSNEFGSCIPEGEQIVQWGTDLSIQFTPAPDCEVTSVFLDGYPLVPVPQSGYVIENVTADHTLVVDFREANIAYFPILIDDCDTPTDWDLNALSVPHGLVYGSASIGRNWVNESAYSFCVNSHSGLHTYFGQWEMLMGPDSENQKTDLSQILWPGIKAEYQGEIRQLLIKVLDVSSSQSNTNLSLRLELKSSNGNIVASQTWSNLLQFAYPHTFTMELDPTSLDDVEMVVWVADNALVGDCITVDRLAFNAAMKIVDPEVQAFLWNYSNLMYNQDPVSGMFKDRSNAEFGTFENVTATGKAAKVTALAYVADIIEQEVAEQTVALIVESILALPRGPVGVNQLVPHFTCAGGSTILTGTEWSTVDFAMTILDCYLALEILGDRTEDQDSLLAMLARIDWADLLVEADGKTFLSHGYAADGTLLTPYWNHYGNETLSANLAMAACTGHLLAMEGPPCFGGSAFIEFARVPILIDGTDRYGNNHWQTRRELLESQLSWYQQPENYNPFLVSAHLSGLSAAENALISRGVSPANAYKAYGIGGSGGNAIDGDASVIVGHFSGLIAADSLDAALQIWESLRDCDASALAGEILVSPWNTLESMSVDPATGNCVVNRLRGSWNLALACDGWIVMLSQANDALTAAVQSAEPIQRALNALYFDHETPLKSLVTIEMQQTDMVLNWDTQTIYGNSATQDVADYAIFYSEHCYDSDSDFYFLTVTDTTTFTHERVVEFSEIMCYRVMPLSTAERERLEANPLLGSASMSDIREFLHRN